MGAFEHQIEELVAFARDRDNNDRSVLFCELTELFTTGRAPHDPADREHLLDVIEALVPHVAPNTRAGVAGELSDMHHPPMDLVMRLIYDDADLVSNLITNAPMDEDSLIEFIAKTGRAHHQDLAARTDLSANVWIALARAAPNMPINRLHNENALWDDDLGKDTHQGPIVSKNAEELGINLFMTRPAPEEKIKPRPATKAPRPAIKDTSKSSGDGEQEANVFFNGSMAANDLARTALTRQEKRALDQHVEHKMPTATVAIDDFNWDQHVANDLGWALLTSREGTIVDLSHSARTFMGLASERLIGMHLVDLIGLNDRAEHPVVRAISRHGAIHDAPVVLFVGPVGRASWTLTAIPNFENASGLFEGFSCHFSPVPVSDEDIPVFLDEIGDDEPVESMMGNFHAKNITSITGEVPIITESPLFIEEDDDSQDPGIESVPAFSADENATQALTEAVARSMDTSIDSIREQAKLMARDRMSEIQDQLETSAISAWPTIISKATKRPAHVEPEAADEDEDNSLDDIFEPQAAARPPASAPVKRHEPKPLQQTSSPAKTPQPAPMTANIMNEQDVLDDLVETTRMAKQALISEEHIAAKHHQRIATIKHMLSMMEEAGERLKAHHPGEDPVTIQLDADIARTCAKALKDLLENKVE